MPAAAFPGSRRLSWETLLAIPVGLATPGPDGTGPADLILLGRPGLRYPGPYPAGINRAGWSCLPSPTPVGGPSAAPTSPPR